MTYSPDPGRYDGRMPYRRTGRSGLALPAISLGLWHNFGDDVPFERQREILTTLGCTQMQGWLFSPAIPAAAFRKLLTSHLSTCAA